MIKVSIVKSKDKPIVAIVEDTVINYSEVLHGAISVDFNRCVAQVSANDCTTHIRYDVITISSELYTKLYNGSFIYVD